LDFGELITIVAALRLFKYHRYEEIAVKVDENTALLPALGL
jgi:hypothetical protein